METRRVLKATAAPLAPLAVTKTTNHNRKLAEIENDENDKEQTTIVCGKKGVRQDATETPQEKTTGKEKIQPAESVVESSTSPSPNKVKKKFGRTRKTATQFTPRKTALVVQNLNPPNPTHHPHHTRQMKKPSITMKIRPQTINLNNWGKESVVGLHATPTEQMKPKC